MIRTFKAYYILAIRGKVFAVIDNNLQNASCFLRPNDIRIGYTKKKKTILETIWNYFCHAGFKTDDANTNVVRLKNQSISQMKCIAIGLMFNSHLYVAEIQIEEEICYVVINLQTIEQANTDDEREKSEAPRPIMALHQVKKL